MEPPPADRTPSAAPGGAHAPSEIWTQSRGAVRRADQTEGEADGPPSGPVASVLEANPLSVPPAALAARARELVGRTTPGRAVLLSSAGWIESEDSATPGGPAFSTWTAAGWSGFGVAVEAVLSEIRPRGLELWVPTHAASVASDPHGLKVWLSRQEHSGARIVLDPLAMLTPGMLAASEDHLGRIHDALGGHPAVVAVRLRPSAGANEDGHGVPADLLAPFARLGRPVIVETAAEAEIVRRWASAAADA